MADMELQYIKHDPDYQKKCGKEHGRFICHHNPECRCLKRECYNCGWNPKVAQARTVALRESLGR